MKLQTGNKEADCVLAKMEKYYGSGERVLRSLLDIYLRMTVMLPEDTEKEPSLSELGSLWLKRRKG